MVRAIRIARTSVRIPAPRITIVAARTQPRQEISKMSTVSLIIAGAGRSSRFTGPVAKTYLPIGPKPVFLWSLDCFSDFTEITQRLLLVAPADMSMVRDKWGQDLHDRNVQLVAGGPRRFESVRNALELVDPSVDLVAVHDGARPAVSPAVIGEAFAQAAASGAAIVARQVNETLKKADTDNRAVHVPDRFSYWLAQTPQVFHRDLLIQAYAAWPAEGAEPTDDAQVVEVLSQKAALVACGPENIKITTAADLKVVESILLSP